MTKLSPLDITAMVLVIIGALNWGLVGLTQGQFDLVKALFSAWPAVVWLVYDIIGIAAVYIAFICPKLTKL